MTAEFHPDHAEQPERADETGAVQACSLCGAPVADGAARCDACGLHLGGGEGRPSPFSRVTMWGLIAALVAVYLVTLTIVAVAR